VCIVDAKEEDLFKFALRRVLLGCGIQVSWLLALPSTAPTENLLSPALSQNKHHQAQKIM
jgi:hypothetical protein